MTVGRVVPGVLLLLAGTVAGCATAPSTAGPGAAGGVPRRVAHESDATADAYYQFTVAQMLVQNGRFKDAIPPMEEALRRDPNSAFLWAQLAQWLVRADQPAEALTAARRAVQLAPDESQPHLTLAEQLRAQKNYTEAEAELDQAIALSPNSDEAYLTLARYQV